MGWIDTIRSLLGLQSNDRGGTGDTEITVEREPEASAERAVKEPVEADVEAGESVDGEEGSVEAAAGESEVVEDEASEAVEDETPEVVEDDGSQGSEDEAPEAVEDDGSEAVEDDDSEAVDAASSEAVEDPPETEETVSESTEEPPEQETPSDQEASVALTDIKGIGSAYADRLVEAGVDAVDDLAAADAADLSEATGISEKRLQRWIDRAQDR